MKAQITLSTTPDLFCTVQTAELTVGVGPKVKHGRWSDVATAGEESIERCPTIGSGIVMDATTWAIDILVSDDVALRSEAFDFLLDNVIYSIVIAGQKCVPPFLLICYKLHNYSSWIVEVVDGKEPLK